MTSVPWQFRGAWWEVVGTFADEQKRLLLNDRTVTIGRNDGSRRTMYVAGGRDYGEEAVVQLADEPKGAVTTGLYLKLRADDRTLLPGAMINEMYTTLKRFGDDGLPYLPWGRFTRICRAKRGPRLMSDAAR